MTNKITHFFPEQNIHFCRPPKDAETRLVNSGVFVIIGLQMLGFISKRAIENLRVVESVEWMGSIIIKRPAIAKPLQRACNLLTTKIGSSYGARPALPRRSSIDYYRCGVCGISGRLAGLPMNSSRLRGIASS